MSLSEFSGRDPVEAWVGLGANLGEARATLQGALDALARHPLTAGLRVAGWYRSAPVDATGPDYLNTVAALRTRLTAPALLDLLQTLERAAGRERPYRHAPRTLDLDLLLYGDARIESPRLSVPHPRWRERAFVLRPLAELAPQRVDPAWLAAVADQRLQRLGEGVQNAM